MDGALAGDVSARELSATAPRAVLAAEAEKENYYGPDLHIGATFYPAAHDTLSGRGPGAIAAQARLAHLAAEHANGGATPSAHLIGLKAADIQARISLAVMRGATQAVVKQGREGIFAAIAAARKLPRHRFTEPAALQIEDGSAN